MKKTILISSFILALGGCATNQQNGALLGGMTGVAVGKTLGGTPGAIVGGVIGAETGVRLGRNLDREYPEIAQVKPSELYQIAPPGVVYVQPYYAPPAPNWVWVYTPRYGWGYHHPRLGFYHRRRY